MSMHESAFLRPPGSLAPELVTRAHAVLRQRAGVEREWAWLQMAQQLGATKTLPQNIKEAIILDGAGLETVQRVQAQLAAGADADTAYPFLELIKAVIRSGTWQHWSRIYAEVTLTSFEDFVASAPPIGLGLTLDQLRELCADDLEALALIDQALEA